jgi:hypothetical protein
MSDQDDQPTEQHMNNIPEAEETQAEFLMRLKGALSVPAQTPDGDTLPGGWRVWRPRLMRIIEGAEGRTGAPRKIDSVIEWLLRETRNGARPITNGLKARCRTETKVSWKTVNRAAKAIEASKTDKSNSV